MEPRPHRRLTDPTWLLRYAMANPKRALIYAAVVAGVILVVAVSLAIQAIPVWIAALVAGLALTVVARESVRRARLLWAASEQSTGSVTGGVVSVSGQVVAANDRRLTSEHGTTECLAYESIETKRVNESQGSSKSTRVTQNVLPFYLDDGSGPVLVSATTGTLTLTADHTGTSGSKRQKEGVVREGDRVTVYGEVEQTIPGNVLSRGGGSEPELTVTTGPEYGDVIVTDKSGRRVLAGQAVYALGWIGIGATLVVAAIALAAGLVSV